MPFNSHNSLATTLTCLSIQEFDTTPKGELVEHLFRALQQRPLRKLTLPNLSSAAALTPYFLATQVRALFVLFYGYSSSVRVQSVGLKHGVHVHEVQAVRFAFYAGSMSLNWSQLLGVHCRNTYLLRRDMRVLSSAQLPLYRSGYSVIGTFFFSFSQIVYVNRPTEVDEQDKLVWFVYPEQSDLDVHALTPGGRTQALTKECDPTVLVDPIRFEASNEAVRFALFMDVSKLNPSLTVTHVQ